MTPTVTWNGDEWGCEIELPAWKPFLSKQSTGMVGVGFLPPQDGPRDAPPTPAQVAALEHLVEVQADLRLADEVAIRAYYDGVRPKYVAFAVTFPDFMGDPLVSMPEQPDAATLASPHDLDGLFVHAETLGGLAYIGFSMHATWEPEHGVGLVTHDRRVVEVGGADTSFGWIKDPGRAEGCESSARGSHAAGVARARGRSPRPG